jgi:hypothetical protein
MKFAPVMRGRIPPSESNGWEVAVTSIGGALPSWAHTKLAPTRQSHFEIIINDVKIGRKIPIVRSAEGAQLFLAWGKGIPILPPPGVSISAIRRGELGLCVMICPPADAPSSRHLA